MKLLSSHPKIVAGFLATSMVLSTASIALAHDVNLADNDIRDIRVQERTEIRGIKASSTLEVRRDKEDMREDHASTTAAIKAVHAQTKIAVKAKLDEKRQEKVLNVLKRYISEEMKHINQLSKRTNELTTVTLKIKVAGRDTAQADGFLIDARVKLAHASSTLASLSLTASSTVSSSTPGQRLQSFKSQFDSVKQDLKTVHTDLSDAISSLKGIGRGIDFEKHGTSTRENASTTVTASTTSSTQ